MFLRLASVLIASGLLGAGSVQAQEPRAPAGFRESFRLEAPASFVADRPTQVWCARNDSVWHAAKQGAGSDGYALIQGDVTFYPAGTCATLEAWRPGSPVTSLFGLDLIVLVHESFHVSGTTDERAAQCQAKRKLAEVAIRFFGFKPYTAKIRTLVRLAYVRASAIPSDC